MRIGVAEVIRVRFGSHRRAKFSSGSFGSAWDHSCAPSRRLVQSGSLGFSRVRIDIAGFISVHEGSLRRA